MEAKFLVEEDKFTAKKYKMLPFLTEKHKTWNNIIWFRAAGYW
jgi:hypothetical protein